MIIWLGRHKGAITFALSLLLILLLLANAWKYRIVSAEWLAEQKDALSALGSIVTMTILVAGSVFSYYRFFRGRTLSLRTELTLDISIHEAPGYLIHAITLTAKNVGSSTIWNPKPLISVRIHGPQENDVERKIDNWWEEAVAGGENLAAVIDSGETVTFFAHQHIPKAAWAVTYTASLRADLGDTWYTSKTVSNKV